MRHKLLSSSRVLLKIATFFWEEALFLVYVTSGIQLLMLYAIQCVFLLLTFFSNISASFSAAGYSSSISPSEFSFLLVSILGFIILGFFFSAALRLCGRVSFVPFHVPLNMCKRSENVPLPSPSGPAFIFLFLIIFSDVELLLCIDFLFLDHVLFELLLLLIDLVTTLPLLCCSLARTLSYLVLLHITHHYLITSQLPSDFCAFWVFALSIVLSGDVHPNPGPPVVGEFSAGFLSFCNWNLNSLASGDFSRITLLDAENTIHKYDIISLCETSLNDSTPVSPDAIPGYYFHSLDHPSGERRGGVGIFYKESLPLRVRTDLCFDECLVTELRFGRKKIFFTVFYRSPSNAASSPEFQSFMDSFRNLRESIQGEKPYASFFAGDINGHSQEWYAEGNTNAEGSALSGLFTELQLHQLIREPTHFFNDFSNPSCIDIVLTDQPNLVMNSGVRPSLDPLVKHQMTFCKINFKIPPPPKYDRRVWHFDRAQPGLVRRALSLFPWEERLGGLADPSDMVDLLTSTILNVVSNFVPNEVKRVRPSEPAWFNDDIRYRLKKQNRLFQRYKYGGYLPAGRAALDEYRSETAILIESSKENYLRAQGCRLADQSTGQKSYWKIMNQFLNKAKIPRIPPLFLGGNFVVCCKEKAEAFNEYFAKQCTPFDTPSTLPQVRYHTADRLSQFVITVADVADLLKVLKAGKAHGHDDISVRMIQLCGNEICQPLVIVFRSILDTGILSVSVEAG